MVPLSHSTRLVSSAVCQARHSHVPARRCLVRHEEFPCRVILIGSKARVVPASLLRVLDSGDPECSSAPTEHCAPS